MNKHHTSCFHRHHIDSVRSSDCSQQVDDSHLLIHNQSGHDCHRNNHNSGLIQHDKLIKSTSTTAFRKRRTTIPSNHQRLQSLLSSTFLIVIRLSILLIIGFILYYAFIYIYPKPKKNGWERIWYTMIDWLSGE
ncbi:unnamed protein product [Rotaria sp. Silwood2]|nr:unnamed protein product [Rotaria sp. Silwood2]CAF4094074.1 unnamed protein product [Rotaria sp. Silwood2]